MSPGSRSLALALVALGWAGCDSIPEPITKTDFSAAPAPLSTVDAGSALDPALTQLPKIVYRLGPGDQLGIEVVGDATTRTLLTVGPDGMIYYYLLPGLNVWGLTLPEARDRLRSALQAFFRGPFVVSLTLHSVSSQRIWVLGRVNSPGVFTLAGPTTLLDALAQAGGLSSSSNLGNLAAVLGINSTAGGAESADLSRSFVIRGGRRLPIDFRRLLRDGDLSQNIYLQAGDFIFLPSSHSAEVHVLGAVVQPHSVRIKGQATLVQVIAEAGGLAEGAYPSNVAVLRGSLSQPQIGIVALNQVVRGKARDIQLEPGDIVYVPYTPYRTLERYANLILDTFARTVGVNEGAKAVTGNATSAAVNVSVTP